MRTHRTRSLFINNRFLIFHGVNLLKLCQIWHSGSKKQCDAQVRYLKVIEKSGYQALPWVRYITAGGEYEIRWVLSIHSICHASKSHPSRCCTVQHLVLFVRLHKPVEVAIVLGDCVCRQLEGCLSVCVCGAAQNGLRLLFGTRFRPRHNYKVTGANCLWECSPCTLLLSMATRGETCGSRIHRTVQFGLEAEATLHMMLYSSFFGVYLRKRNTS